MPENPRLESAKPEPTQQFIISEGQVRTAFIGSAVLMVTTLALILILAFVRPHGRFTPADTSQYQSTVNAAAEQLHGFEVLEDGRARIDISRAMELVAERGVAKPFTVLAQADTAPGGTGTEGGSASLPDGSAVYSNCAGCHQANGQGVPSAFPPLAGHAPELYLTDRDYLVTVLLNGLQGEITVQGQKFNGFMPQWAQLGDAEIAAVINYILTAWGNDALLPGDFAPYSADEVTAQRDKTIGTSGTYELRQQLGLP